MTSKHVPQRTCIACRKIHPKRAMVRIVRTPDRGVEVDETGKKSGRGAYLCRNRRCWELALKKDGLKHALQTSLTDEERTTLEEFARGLPEPEE